MDGIRVERAIVCRNLAAEADRFELDPADQLRAERRWAVLGVWHSHPAGPARPSVRDRAGGFAAWWQVIVGLGSDPAELRAWYALEDGGELSEGRLA